MELLPAVSVIIPARNASKYLRQCLSSIASVEYPRHLVEVIVADNGSTDDTAEIATQFGAAVVDASGLKVGAVRNLGAAHARGDVLAFTDSDIVVGTTWIVSAVEALGVVGVGAVGGVCRAPETGTWVEKAWTTCSCDSMRKTNCLAGSNFVIGRELFKKLGGFDETIVVAEDDDLSRKIISQELILLNVPGCAVTHLGYPATLGALAMRQVLFGGTVVPCPLALFEAMTLLAVTFYLSLIVLLVALVTGQYGKCLISLMMLFLVPLIVAAKKATKGNEFYNNIYHLCMLWPIYFFYFLGKSLRFTKYAVEKSKALVN
ncbi:glycosyltransferase [Geomonas anaerohicana]|uniref:Glycosyltransferase n=1 Tax=Geomonas anaerohicana TaxID=2798583 RepID=A0ABS0YC08_9BACT|nr:glycosyltransferase [Geomonas anaerohicana]MBJ6749832.1 glycosyltransferase [Geomonas anaerohicana]